MMVASAPGMSAGRELGTVDAVDIFSLMLGVLGIRDPKQSEDGQDTNKLIADHE